jgi:hypothetical protein
MRRLNNAGLRTASGKISLAPAPPKAEATAVRHPRHKAKGEIDQSYYERLRSATSVISGKRSLQSWPLLATAERACRRAARSGDSRHA